MLISDWSSDVCSSDLIARGNVDILEAGEATIERDRIGAGRAGAVENQRIIAVATEQIVGSVDHPAAVDDIVAVAQRDRRGAARRVVEVDNIVAPSRIHNPNIVGDVAVYAASASAYVAHTRAQQPLAQGPRHRNTTTPLRRSAEL